jgi:2-dehydropantoate 2-reductase
MRIAVIGAGAIGGWVAARLALAGNEVSVIVRPEALSAYSKGISLSEEGKRSRAEVRAFASAEELGKQQLIIIAVKAPALAAAAETARPLMDGGTLVLPMMNGVPWWFLDGEPLQSIDPDGAIGGLVPQDAAIGCVVHAACRRTSPAEVEVVVADRLIIGEPRGGPSDRVERLQELLGSAGIRTELSNDVRRDIWYKLWGNMTINPVSALTLASADRILAEQGLRNFILSCMAEAAQVGAAIGQPIAETGEQRMAVTARLGAFKTSMLQDVEAGRPLELEALVGAPREIGRRFGVATPNLDCLYALSRLMAESRGLL